MPSRKRRFFAAAILGLILASAFTGWLNRIPRPRYVVTDIGVLPGATLSSASSLNNRGDVVGLSGSERRDLQHAFLCHNGTLTDLGEFRLISSHNGPAINDSGQITGTMRVTVVGARWRNHAFLRDAGGRHDLGTQGGPMSMGEAINERGQVAGEAWSSGPGAFTSHAFLYGSGRMTPLGTLPGCADATPTGINAVGQIVGYCERQSGGGPIAFLYDSRTRQMTALATQPGMDSEAQAINEGGEIIGSTVLPHEREYATLWAGGKRIDLGTLPGTDSTEGEALNNRGEAVGTARIEPNTLGRLVGDHPIRLGLLAPLTRPSITEHAFVYQDGRMQDLNDLILADADWTLERAVDVNDRGQIVGLGLHHGRERAFLLTPVR